ncbi:MAG: hypothetical protein ACTSRA_06965, partial [Promethearchaeota archaeon]
MIGGTDLFFRGRRARNTPRWSILALITLLLSFGIAAGFSFVLDPLSANPESRGKSTSDSGVSIDGEGGASMRDTVVFFYGGLPSPAYYPGEQPWNRTWGGSSEDWGYSVWGNGSYLYTCGYTMSFGSGSADLLLVKWDSDGNQVWNRTWGGSSYDFGYSVWGNGSYLYTCGYTESFGAGSADLLLVKWDSDGNQVWNMTWSGSSSDFGGSVWGDGSYLYTCGFTMSFGSGSADLLLVKWDSDGNQVWNRTWGGSDWNWGNSIWGDGSYLYICGYTESSGAGNDDLVLVKWDSDGNPVWNRTWGGSNWDEGYSVWANGSYLYTCGFTRSFGAGSPDLLLVKWDTTMIDLMESDVDGDGLSYYEEVYIFNTNATNNDTDSDGLSDGDEILVHNTNATNNDTDSDGLSDG